jgi:uncharacterized glyoxalase superfamily metalloenzyme YdcJ
MHILEVERGQERAPYKEGEREERTCALTHMARNLYPEDDVVKASSPNAVTPSVAANTLNQEATVYKVRSLAASHLLMPSPSQCALVPLA